MNQHCNNCGRYMSEGGRPCFCAPFYRRAAWAVREHFRLAARRRRIDARVKDQGLFMNGKGWAA